MSRSVLIVDDHERFRSVARRALEGDGWDVVGEAADGLSGLAAAGQLTPDVMLLDVMLPDVSGLEIARRMQSEVPDTEVVLVSTHEEDDYAGLAAENGARGFLPKAELSGDALDALLDR
ncbi:MAG: response regulator transcription factor [Solirubrobacteraceae bacterium]|nr:response regulator transcription factor [Solirubrobacteraceae bacterium]